MVYPWKFIEVGGEVLRKVDVVIDLTGISHVECIDSDNTCGTVVEMNPEIMNSI